MLGFVNPCEVEDCDCDDYEADPDAPEIDR